jgi:hypothetical protein
MCSQGLKIPVAICTASTLLHSTAVRQLYTCSMLTGTSCQHACTKQGPATLSYTGCPSAPPLLLLLLLCYLAPEASHVLPTMPN